MPETSSTSHAAPLSMQSCPEWTERNSRLLAAWSQFRRENHEAQALPAVPRCLLWGAIEEQHLWVRWDACHGPLPKLTDLPGAIHVRQLPDALLAAFHCSTSARPPSQVEGSQGTPLGWHLIVEKIGADAPLGTVFVGRQPVGIVPIDLSPNTPLRSASAHPSQFLEVPPETAEPNRITTRILRLRGLQPGFNCGLADPCLYPPENLHHGGTLPNVDSYQRYIYVHGTNHEHRLGTPFSSGCVLLGNATIAALFNLISTDTPMLISRHGKAESIDSAKS